MKITKPKYNLNIVVVILFLLSLLFVDVGYSYIKTNLSSKANLSLSNDIKNKKYIEILGNEMVAYMDNTKSPYVNSTTGINFYAVPSDTNGKGIYVRSGTENDSYPIYYFRGDVDNNHVIFGGFCWKIVRTTENGGTKMIYDGIANNNQCNNTGTSSQIGTSAFNSNYVALADVGYMYGTRYSYTSWTDTSYVYGSDVSYANNVYTLSNTSTSNTIANVKTKHYTCKLTTTGTCSTVYYVYHFYNGRAYAISLTNGKKLENIISESFANTNDSAIKKSIDTWFANNLTNQESNLEDAVWCNDRSIVSGGYVKNGDVTANTYFGAFETKKLTTTSANPKLKDIEACPNQSDRYTKSDTTVGNGKLKYSIGLLTADEATVAGNGWAGSSTSYLNSGQYYWLSAPYYAALYGYYSNSFYMNPSGSLLNDTASVNLGVRPAIVLKKGMISSSGNGTKGSPYVVN